MLERVIALRCPPDRAFRVFTQQTDLWWPRGHRRTADARMVLEGFVDGRLMERTADGEEWVLGRVVAHDPPVRLAFHWFPGSPAAPTEVDVGFSATVAGSEIRVVHRALSEGAIAAWPGKVALFERGWDSVLPALAEFIDNEA
jgi:uncharacterized protein YndB with AHSA1/START domain